MIEKSRAKSLFLSGLEFDGATEKEIEESCSLCGAVQVDGSVVLRHIVSNNILCVDCLGFIAMLEPSDPIHD